ncbi:recombinase family protein [Mycobacterium arosiense]|uniref:recombinase family protein n=1 Tax=Mycobacterium arosiense TaxID=425468 RepID=UPI0009F46DC0|nr:recombinase family protein [Mycobacterium arosiense]
MADAPQRPGPAVRALIIVRLSRLTDATTSPERQLETCRDLCRRRGYEVVGIAEDLDVSAGATSPFNRPQLGDWLTNRLGEFDVLVVYRMDRIVRRLLDLADLIRWCQEHHVALVSASEAFLDLTAPFGDIVALLVAKVAEMELAAISERNASAARYNIRAGKYRGGIPPWGYLPSDATGEWRLVQDPEQVKVIREVVERVLSGEPLRAVAHDLTARKVLTPRDRFAQHQGREVRGYAWHSSPLKRSLTSETLLGYAMSGDSPVRAEDGSPIIRADPILTRETFDRLAVELAERENRKEPTKRSTGLLLQIIYCGTCGRPAYRLKGGPGRKPRYRCASAQYKEPCGNPSIPMDYADEVVERILLGMLGKSERLERVWDAGSDHSAELAEIDATLEDLVAVLGSGDFRAGTPQRITLNRRISELAKRQAELSAQAVKPAGWTWEPTGELFGDWWARQDITQRNVWLRSMNVRLEFQRGQVSLDLGDVLKLTEHLKATGPAADWLAVFEAMRDNGIAGIEMTCDEVQFATNER